MATKAEALNELETRYLRFRSQLIDLPEPAWAESWLGDWGLSELLGHMAGWWREMTPAFDRVKRGERPTPEGVNYGDPEPFNARFAKDAPAGAEGLANWDAAYESYLQAAKELPEELYGTNEQGRPRIGNRLVHGAGIEHFDEHEPALKGWLSSRR